MNNNEKKIWISTLSMLLIVILSFFVMVTFSLDEEYNIIVVAVFGGLAWFGLCQLCELIIIGEK